MDEQCQQADVAGLTRFAYKHELRLARTIENQSPAWANGGDYDLAASLCSRDVGRASRTASKLQVGMVRSNTYTALVNAMPHGGYTQNGYGKDMGISSLDEYTPIQHIRASHD